MMKILIMGLSGSGKTTLAKKLTEEVSQNFPVEWINADVIRQQYQDWDFSNAGRIRQAERMRDLANIAASGSIVAICDFVCPTKQTREIFDADILIWMDTTQSSEYADTDAIFEPPTREEYDFRIISTDDIDQWSKTLADLVWILE